MTVYPEDDREGEEERREEVRLVENITRVKALDTDERLDVLIDEVRELKEAIKNLTNVLDKSIK